MIKILHVLGLPEITTDDLFNNREKEPIVIDALRQQARFVKIEEGYPHFLESQAILNIYEGITCVTKIYAWSIQFSLKWLQYINRKWTGIFFTQRSNTIICKN